MTGTERTHKDALVDLVTALRGTGDPAEVANQLTDTLEGAFNAADLITKDDLDDELGDPDAGALVRSEDLERQVDQYLSHNLAETLDAEEVLRQADVHEQLLLAMSEMSLLDRVRWLIFGSVVIKVEEVKSKR